MHLSRAGFFWWKKHETKCFVSGCHVVNWLENMDPVKMHIYNFPECKYAVALKKAPTSLTEMEDFTAVRILLDMGYNKKYVKKAYDLVKSKKRDLNTTYLLEEIFSLPTTKMMKKPDVIYCPPQQAKYLICSKKIDATKHVKLANECEFLKKKLVHLENKYICLHCKTDKRDYCNLPCGHITTCDKCVRSHMHCIQCGTMIRGVVKVFPV